MNTIHILYADGISAAGNTPQDAVKTFYDAAQPFRFACVVHGGLRAYDWTDLVK